MNTLTQWIEDKKEWYSGDGNKPIRDALDDLLSSLPQLAETMKAEMLEKVGENEEIEVGKTVGDESFKIIRNQERSRIRTIIQDYFSK